MSMLYKWLGVYVTPEQAAAHSKAIVNGNEKYFEKMSNHIRLKVNWPPDKTVLKCALGSTKITGIVEFTIMIRPDIIKYYYVQLFVQTRTTLRGYEAFQYDFKMDNLLPMEVHLYPGDANFTVRLIEIRTNTTVAAHTSHVYIAAADNEMFI